MNMSEPRRGTRLTESYSPAHGRPSSITGTQGNYLNHDTTAASLENDGKPPRKRQRVKLSCYTCRRRKLSCNRLQPCNRCTKSGTAADCTYESPSGAGAGALRPREVNTRQKEGSESGEGPNVNGEVDGRGHGTNDSHGETQSDKDRITSLENDLKELRSLIASRGLEDSRSADSGRSLEGSTIEGPSPKTQREISDTTAVPSGVGSYTERPGEGDECLKDVEPDCCDGKRDSEGNMNVYRGPEFPTRYCFSRSCLYVRADETETFVLIMLWRFSMFCRPTESTCQETWSLMLFTRSCPVSLPL